MGTTTSRLGEKKIHSYIKKYLFLNKSACKKETEPG